MAGSFNTPRVCSHLPAAVPMIPCFVTRVACRLSPPLPGIPSYHITTSLTSPPPLT